MKITSIIIGIIAVVVGGGLWLGSTLGSTSTVSSVYSRISPTTSSSNAPVKEFNRTISNFAYQPPSVDVDLGDRVVITITNTDDVTHGINLPAFGIAEFVQPGQDKRIEFVADKAGSPELFCSSDHGEKLLINVRA